MLLSILYTVWGTLQEQPIRQQRSVSKQHNHAWTNTSCIGINIWYENIEGREGANDNLLQYEYIRQSWLWHYAHDDADMRLVRETIHSALVASSQPARSVHQVYKHEYEQQIKKAAVRSRVSSKHIFTSCVSYY